MKTRRETRGSETTINRWLTEDIVREGYGSVAVVWYISDDPTLSLSIENRFPGSGNRWMATSGKALFVGNCLSIVISSTLRHGGAATTTTKRFVLGMGY
jgi:hypothetical protein